MALTPPPTNTSPSDSSAGNSYQRWFNYLYNQVNSLTDTVGNPNATYIVQVADSSLPAAQAMSQLPTGLMFVTASTGVIGSTGSMSVSPSHGGTGHTTYADGQILIGDSLTPGLLNLTTITAGTGIAVANGHGTITISTSETLPVITEIKHQVFTSSGTYTPTTGMVYCIVEAMGAGGGGGSSLGSSLLNAIGLGGYGGSYARSKLSASQIGTSKPVTIGASGVFGTCTSATVGGGAGSTSPTSGGTTYLGGAPGSGSSLIIATGGSGGSNNFNVSTTSFFCAGQSISGTNMGDFTSPGQNPSNGFIVSGQAAVGSSGGNSMWGEGGVGLCQDITGAYTNISNSATGYGAGGGSGVYFAAGSSNAAFTQTGGGGSPGCIIITEFLSV